MSTTQTLENQTQEKWKVAQKSTNGKAPTSKAPISKINSYHAETLATLVLEFRPVIDMSDDEFFTFCQVNQDLRIERNANGESLIMPLTGWETGQKNALITSELAHWARRDKTGVATDSSTGYKLPNGATRAPDAAWIRKTRLAELTKEQREKFLPIVPDFVIELRLPSDGLKTVKDKMKEYLKNGVQLGWLIDPPNRSVYIYRPDAEVEHLQHITQVAGDPLLPGFVLELTELWESEEESQ